MPRTKKVSKMHMRGEGFLDDALSGLKNVFGKVRQAYNWARTNRPVSKALDMPILGQAIRNSPFGAAASVAAELGFGKK